MLIARHHDRLTRNPDDFARLIQICGKAEIKISTYTGGELDLPLRAVGSTALWGTGRWGGPSGLDGFRLRSP